MHERPAPHRWSFWLLALIAYGPALATAPGVVATDTKQYLYLDPGRLLRGASSLWDPQQFGGWVTHQNIGYLWPMGPFFWVAHALGAPVWVAQRLWLGTLLLAAGAGVRHLCRVFGLAPMAGLAAAALYQLSPYALGYVSRTSVLLSPWAGLGWMVAFTVLAARRGGWRHPALFALAVGTVGGINATALVLCGLGPALWLVYATWGRRELTVRHAGAVAGRIAVLTAGVSAWWVIALVTQARYGANVLTYSETVPAVSSTSSGAEVLRGLGYWLFYGGDVTGRWSSASTPYLQSPGLMLLGFALATLGVVAAVMARWSQRGFTVMLVAAGMIVAISAHPYGSPSPLGALIKSGSARSTLVLALRSSTRAAPLLLLGLALAVGALLTGVREWSPRWAPRASLAVVVLAVLNLPALWNGTYVDRLLRRPQDVPAAWRQAAAALDSAGGSTRVLEAPGQEFAAYRWGTTNDAILPGLMSRPTLTRDLLPLGGPATMNLLLALDDRFQNGTVTPAAVAPVARRLGVGDIVVRGDAAFERYRTPRPAESVALLERAPGLGPSTTYGPPVPHVAVVAGLDEVALSSPSAAAEVAPVVRFPVRQPTAIVRAEPADATVLLSGDGDGIVDMGPALDGPVVYSASLSDPSTLRASVPADALVVITDSNRKRARQWRGSQDTTGYTEEADGGVLRVDPADARLPLFAGVSTSAFTVAEQRGAVRASATAYGEPNAYQPEDRAAMAIDGDARTAWRVGDRGAVLGERLHLDLASVTAVDHVTLLQPPGAANRWITGVRLRTDAGAAVVALTEASHAAPGQVVAVPSGPTHAIDIEIVATDTDSRGTFFGLDAVGFAEVSVGNLHGDELVRPPTDALDALGSGSATHPLTYSFTRERVDPRDRWRADPEPALARMVPVPTDRTFTLRGTARRSAMASDQVRHQLDAAAGPVAPWAEATSELHGVPVAGAASALDGDPSTAWTSAFGTTVGASITVHLPSPTSVGHLDLSVVADGRHSVPTEVVVRIGDQERRVTLPALVDDAARSDGREVPISFAPVTGGTVTVTVAAAREETTVDRRYGETVVLPVAIADLGLSGVRVRATLPASDDGCRSDLLTLDGRAIGVRLSAASDDGAFSVEGCGGTEPMALAAGEHVLRAAKGIDAGIDLDHIVLTSLVPRAANVTGTRPTTRVVSQTRTALTVEVSAHRTVWLVDGQSQNAGWHATVAGRDLGPSRLIDGNANGWLVDPDPSGAPTIVRIRWVPQRVVNLGLVVSAASALGCILLLIVRRRRRVTTPTSPATEVVGLRSPFGPGSTHPPRSAVLVALGIGALGALVITPGYGAALLVVTLIGAWRPRWRLLTSLGAIASVGMIGLFYAARQALSRPAAGFGWIQAFEPAHHVALLAVLLLVADVALTRTGGHGHEHERGGIDGAGDGEPVGRDGCGHGAPTS